MSARYDYDGAYNEAVPSTLAPLVPASPVVVVSIAEIGNLSTLGDADLVGSVTVDGEEVTPSAWAWRVGGGTTGIDDATAGTTVFTPSAVGTYTATLNAQVDGVWYGATTPRTFTRGTGAPPIVVVTIATVADQLTLAPVLPTVSATIDRGDGLGPVAATITAWAWKCNDATTLVTGATTATPTITPTGAGQHTLSCDATIGGVVYSSRVEVFQVGDADGFITGIDIDFRQAVTLTTDGAYTVDGVSVTMANLSAAATKEMSVANGLYLVHDGTGTPDPRVDIAVKTLLTAAGHTFDPAAYEYRFSWQWEPDQTNVTWGTFFNIIDGGVGAAAERFWIGTSFTNLSIIGGEGSWDDDRAITLASSMSVIVHGHVFDPRYGTKDVDTWDGNTTGLSRYSGNQRSFMVRPQGWTDISVTDWNTSAITASFKVTEAGTTLKLYRFWVAYRSRQ